MKKMMIASIALLLICAPALAGERVISKEQLIQKAQVFVTKYFDKAAYSKVLLDDDGDYEVFLDNGVEIEFNKTGDWREIKGYRESGIDKSLLPHKSIVSYLKANYPSIAISKISRDRDLFSWEYDIELSNGIEFTFNENGEFVKMERD